MIEMTIWSELCMYSVIGIAASVNIRAVVMGLNFLIFVGYVNWILGIVTLDVVKIFNRSSPSIDWGMHNTQQKYGNSLSETLMTQWLSATAETSKTFFLF